MLKRQQTVRDGLAALNDETPCDATRRHATRRDADGCVVQGSDGLNSRFRRFDVGLSPTFLSTELCPNVNGALFYWRHDIQHNEIKHKDIQHKST